jgi:hypothetical protein
MSVSLAALADQSHNEMNIALVAEAETEGSYGGERDRIPPVIPESNHVNPALEIREHASLDIDPLPQAILSRIDPTYSFKPFENDGDLVTPITCLYQCEWEGLATTLEEKGEVWTGTEMGSTTWISSIRLGAYAIPCHSSIMLPLQGMEGPTSMEEAVTRVTGTRYSSSKSSTLGRYIASLIQNGDNHITLLTAAYCALFDRLWW